MGGRRGRLERDGHGPREMASARRALIGCIKDSVANYVLVPCYLSTFAEVVCAASPPSKSVEERPNAIACTLRHSGTTQLQPDGTCSFESLVVRLPFLSLGFELGKSIEERDEAVCSTCTPPNL